MSPGRVYVGDAHTGGGFGDAFGDLDQAFHVEREAGERDPGSMIGFRLRITRSVGNEKSASMPKPSRLKSSSRFSSRDARTAPQRDVHRCPRTSPPSTATAKPTRPHHLTWVETDGSARRRLDAMSV